MSSVNKALIIGNLGKDPDIRTLQASGNKVANLSVATSESWKDKASGEWQERTEWHKVVVFNEAMIRRLEKASKGDKVYIEGKIETRKYTDKDGADKYTTEIVVRPYGGEVVLLSANKEADGFKKAADEVVDDFGLDDEILF